MDKHYMQLKLDDHAKPSFVSASKNYYGTSEDIDEFIETLRHDTHCALYHAELIAAYDRFCNGSEEVSHTVAYQEVPLLLPVKLLKTIPFSLSDYQWEHINTWGCPYFMRCDSVIGEIQWFDTGDEIVKCIRATFTGLQYDITSEEYRDVGGMFWGFPYMLNHKDNTLCNRLAVEAEVYADLEEAAEDIENTEIQDTDFTTFCEEIFGDG